MRCKIGWFLAVVNILLAANAAFFFLAVKKLDFVSWLAINSCTPSIVLFALGFFLDSPFLLGFSSAAMLFYGGGGLFVFRWSTSPADLVPQIGHLFMTAGAVYALLSSIRRKTWKSAFGGLLLGAAVLILIVIPRQTRYQKAHPELLELVGFRPKLSPR